MAFAPTSPVPDLSACSDEAIAAALARLPLQRMERVAVLLLGKLNTDARRSLVQALMVAPSVAGGMAGAAVEGALRGLLNPKKQ